MSPTKPMLPQYFVPVTTNVATTTSKADWVRMHYAENVLNFDLNDNGFTCKCGQHISLVNNNFASNVASHFANQSCVSKRASALQRITCFFKPNKQAYVRPDPAVACLGLWDETIDVDGRPCQTELLGEYSNSFLFYVSGRAVKLKGRCDTDTLRVAKRSIYSTQCLGHCLDHHDRIRTSRTCTACASLKHNSEFRRMLVQAQDPKRFDPSHKLPNQYYSWRHLEVIKILQGDCSPHTTNFTPNIFTLGSEAACPIAQIT